MAQDIQFEPVQSDKVDFEPIQFEPLNSQPATQDSSLTRGGILDSSIPLKQRLLTALEGPSKDTAGHELLGPGLMKIPGLESLGNLIREKTINTGNYYLGAGGSILGDLISGASTALDPRTTFPGHAQVPELVRDIPLEASKPKELLGLPPAPREIERPARFIAGDAGVAENKLYPMDIGPVNPRIGGVDQGTVLPRELEGISNIPPDMAAREGLALGRPERPEYKPNELVRQQFNIGAPNEPYQLPSASVKPSRFFGVESKAPIDEINAEPKPIHAPEATVLPEPGQAKPIKDISGFTANFTSPDITLASRQITKPIADVIVKAQDQKMNWIASTERELADLSSGLDKEDRIQLGQLIDGQDIQNPNPELQLRASKARTILDAVHDMFPEGATKSGEDVGYLENYFTHIHHQPEDIRSAVKSIIDHHFGIFQAPKELPNIEASSTGDLYEKGLGKPSSPYIEPRKDLARKIQYDVNKVFPAYIESAAKVIFDKPAVEAAKAQLAKIPDSNLKELATWYIKNYSNYDSLPGLHKAWNSWASTIARTTSRSLLGFNTGLQTLHLARIPANMWPELGTKYSSIGLKEVATHPIQAWTEAAKLGLLQNEIRPMSFKTPLEKFDSISNFLSLADYLDKAIGYHGYKQMMLDKGMDELSAKLEALKFTKRVSQTTDAARQMKGMSAESNVMGGEVASRLGWQFKQIPAKIAEQYVNIARNIKANPQQGARMVAGVGLALAANEGLRTFHLDPYHMIPSGAWGAFGTTVTKVVNSLSKGNWEKALMDSALWAIPGGQSLKRQIESGPSALNP